VVHSIFSTEFITIDSDASLETLADSRIVGSLTISPEGSLSAKGGSFEALGTTVIDGANLYASAGGRLLLNNATSYSPWGSGNRHRVIRAEGLGSLIEMRGVTSLIGGTAFNTRILVDALHGGTIDLGGVTEIVDPNSGDTRYRSIDLTADAGTIKLPLLTRFIDVYGTTVNGEGLYSTIAVRNRGLIDAPRLTQLQGVHLDLDGTGTFLTSQITSLISSLSSRGVQANHQGDISIGGRWGHF
jgi:hypothetical protein